MKDLLNASLMTLLASVQPDQRSISEPHRTIIMAAGCPGGCVNQCDGSCKGTCTFSCQRNAR